MAADLYRPLFPGAPDDAFPHNRLAHLGEQGHQINPHRQKSLIGRISIRPVSMSVSTRTSGIAGSKYFFSVASSHLINVVCTGLEYIRQRPVARAGVSVKHGKPEQVLDKKASRQELDVRTRQIKDPPRNVSAVSKESTPSNESSTRDLCTRALRTCTGRVPDASQ